MSTKIHPTPIYEKKILNESISVHPKYLNTDNINNVLLKLLVNKLRKKCTSNGLVKVDTISILSRTLGRFLHHDNDAYCHYHVKFEAELCKPREGQIIECIVEEHTETITICYVDDQDESPLEIHLSKQHNIGNKDYANIKKNDTLYVRIIAFNIEANSPQIICIGEFLGKK